MAHPSAFAVLKVYEWYRLDTPLDWVRATVWFVDNMLTAIACVVIANEIRNWRKTLPFNAIQTIGGLFIAYVALLALAHVSLIVLLPTGPWWAALFVYLPLTCVAVATAFVLRLNRTLINAFLRQISVALERAS